MLDRRDFLGAAAAAAMTGPAALAAPGGRVPGPVRASWESLAAAYRTPDWFRDAKFGIWAHWSAQCVPEMGDWYGRKMYLEGDPAYAHHLETYGHPSRAGFMEIENLWKAERWQPERLVDLYAKAGARYFVALACHHDNLDAYDSAHHPWNTLRVGPRRDIVGIWEKLARNAGLRFGVSNHASHAWHWWQTAYGYDTRGPLAGRRYDAWRLRKADGKGKWWEGLDPQDLYTGPFMPPPAGIASPGGMAKWHDTHSGVWTEAAPPGARGARYAANWLARQTDLVGKYRPDLVYMDNYQLPFGAIGLEAAADYYNRAIQWHGGIDVVLNAKRLSAEQRLGVVEDIERGFAADIRPQPWQTCTCIGDWHYDRRIFERHGYKSAKHVVQRLCDIVAKNGNLLLSIPMRGDGSIDTDEEAILADLARWFAANGAGIYGTRPWRSFGEGPNVPPEGMKSEEQMKPYTGEDVRITAGGGGLNLFLLDQPAGESRIACLGRRATGGGVIEGMTLNGGGPVAFRQDEAALVFTLPPEAGRPFVPGLRIEGRGLV